MRASPRFTWPHLRLASRLFTCYCFYSDSTTGTTEQISCCTSCPRLPCLAACYVNYLRPSEGHPLFVLSQTTADACVHIHRSFPLTSARVITINTFAYLQLPVAPACHCLLADCQPKLSRDPKTLLVHSRRASSSRSAPEQRHAIILLLLLSHCLQVASLVPAFSLATNFQRSRHTNKITTTSTTNVSSLSTTTPHSSTLA